MRQALLDPNNAGKTLTCRNCKLDYEQHLDGGKCPFEATSYVDMPFEEFFKFMERNLKRGGPGAIRDLD